MKSKVLILTFLMSILCLNGWGMEQQLGKKLVYSISTDGFVNVRKSPNISSKIVGVLATNRKGAVLMSNKGTWWKVRIDNVVGYVNSKYVKLSSTLAMGNTFFTFFTSWLYCCCCFLSLNVICG